MMLQTRLFDLPICVVDVETTGASMDYGDRIVELGIVRLEGGRVAASFEELVNPGRQIGRGASAITGITNDMVADRPEFGPVWARARELLQGAILVGHNVGFDISFLAGECRRLGHAPTDVIGDSHVLDTVRIARKQLGRGGNGLQRLADRLGLPARSAHRALADCQTTALVLHQLLEPHGAWEVTLERAHELQGGFSTLSMLKTRQSPLPTEIAEALLDGGAVKIAYLDAHNRRSERAVTPKYVRRINGTLTLVAHCHLKNDLRMFKVDRIISILPSLPEGPIMV